MKIKITYLSITCLLCLFLASCSPKNKIEPIDLFNDIPPSWSQELPEMEKYTGNWWESLGDTLFTSYFDTFMKNNTNLLSTYQQLEIAKNSAHIRSAGIFPALALNNSSNARKQNFSGFGFDPSLLGIGSGDSTNSSDSGVLSFSSNIFNLNLGFQWELDIWGKLLNARKSAWKDFEASSNELAYAQFSMMTRFASSYFQAVQLNIQKELSLEKLKTFEELQRIVLERYQKGIASSLDVNLAQSSLAFQKVAVENAKIQSKAGIQFIEISLGKYPFGSLKLTESLPKDFAHVPSGLPSNLLLRRPDLKAAILKVESSNYRVSEAKRGLFPSIALTGSAGTSTSDLKNLLDGDFSVFNIGANILLPVFQGGRLRANVRNAENQLTLSELDAINKILITFQEVEQSIENSISLKKQLSSIQDAVNSSKSAYNLAVNRYETGLTNLITVLDSQQRWFDARQQKNIIEYQLLNSKINLFLALGGVFNDESKEEN